MSIIYISSTYKDLIKEREVAAQAVRRLGHSAIAMEDYVATDKRPLEKCLDDVRRCDVYVGIFALRYGFIPDGYDKSITHLEYEAAKNAGIPRLIFILDETANWPINFVSTGEERKNIDNLRKYLRTEHIVSPFTNSDQLGGLVSTALANLLNKSDTSSPPPPSTTSNEGLRIRPTVSKMCDRVHQVKSFWDFFHSKFKNCPKRPQFYFIHGNDEAGHESFLDHLMKICLKEFIEREWGKENATICLEEVPWPMEGSEEEQKGELLFKLMDNFNTCYETTDFTANVLGNLPCLDKRPLVLIRHNILSSKWDKRTVSVMSWYIRTFWADLECNDNVPLFLIFFNIKYRKSQETGLKRFFQAKENTPERIREQLEQICGLSDDKCPCLLLKELTDVEIEDVLNWFDVNNICERFERKEKAEAIFKDSSDGVVKPKTMAEVERKLKKIIEDNTREEIVL